MGEGKGLKVTQVRLGLARLTLYALVRSREAAVNIASDYASNRVVLVSS